MSLIQANSIQASSIEMYTRPGCGYCAGARQWMNDREQEFVEMDVYADSKHKLEMNRRTSNKTYPQIFIDGVSIGGYEDLLKLQSQGLLDLSQNRKAS